jgi:glycosyltransferase involved in cell wall biosynthesis
VKVALVVRRYWPAVGGIERVAAELAHALRGLGHEVEVVAQRVDEGPQTWLTHLVTEPPAFDAFERDGVRVRQFRLPRARRAALLPLAYEAIPLLPRLTGNRTRRVTAPWYERVAAPAITPLLGDADVVHVLGGAWISTAAVEAARRSRTPVVVTPFVHRGYWRDDPASVRSYRRADAVLATTEADAAELRAVGVPAAAIAVCGLPVPGVQREVEREREPLVVFAGARVPHKGLHLVREAARLVWTEEPDVRFAYIGPGAALANLDPREFDVGAISDEERDEWLGRAWALALPSASESFGLVVAEAWSARTPVVTSEIPVLQELVTRARGGLTVPRTATANARAILALVRDRELARGLGESGFSFWNRELRSEAIALRHVELYERCRSRPHPDG